MKKIILIYSFIFFALISYAQENCGNATDDDGDGLIDCLDPDCKSGVVPIGSYFNTASNGNGGTLAIGTNDSHWQVSTTGITGPYNPAVVMCYIPNVYYSSPWPDCAWITHDSFGLHAGAADFFYKIEFMLPCYTPCGKPYSDSAKFCLFMDFFSDNSVDEIYVNGIPQSAYIAGVPNSSPYIFQGYNSTGITSASLCRSWKAGLNQLIIKVSSGYPFEAFLAQNSTTSPPIVGNPTILPGFSGNLTVCENATVTNLNAATGGGTWSATCGSCINPSTGVFNAIVAGVGNHTITYTITSPCPTSDTLVISVIPKADATILPIETHCINAVPFNLSALHSGGTWSGIGVVDALTGLFDPSISGTGTFTITYMLAGPCPDTATQTITISTPPITSIIGNTSICIGNNNLLEATGGGTYLWSTGSVTASTSISQPGIYWVTINKEGCTDSDTLKATEDLDGGAIYFPNSFTPNNDGLNDKFNAKGVGITEYHLMIFNRWGELCFETKTLNDGWDGTYKGDISMNDLYVWKVNYKTKCGKEEILMRYGHVTIVK